MPDPVIQVENLSKVYNISHQGERPDTFRDAVVGLFKKKPRTKNQEPGTERFHALRDVSFEVKQGEVLGIIGRNGAGKSTLLKILSRITEPTSGRVEIRGRVASLLEVGTGFHPELSGRENIYLNGAILGMRREEIRKKFDQIVEFAAVDRFIDTPVKRYSSGMQVRLAFSVAAHLEPEILVIDEVLAVGDSEFQKRCLGKMKDVAGGGRTVLFVSHNESAVRSLCSRCILLEAGKMARDGDVKTVLGAYLQGPWVTGSETIFRSTGTKPHPSILEARVEARLPGGRHDLNEPLSLEFEVDAKELRGLVLGVHVSNERGDEVHHLSNEISQVPVLIGPGRQWLRLTIPRHCMNVGTYTFSLRLAKRWEESYDYLERCLKVEMVDPEFSYGGTSAEHWQGYASPRLFLWEEVRRV